MESFFCVVILLGSPRYPIDCNTSNPSSDTNKALISSSDCMDWTCNLYEVRGRL